MAGRFIVLDGPDGCGKSTQVKLLAEWLRGQGLDTEAFRDPGTTVVAEKIREILLNPEHIEITTATEVLLYMAARAQMWHEKISPALQHNKCVLCDRWLSSTCAYQGCAGDFGVHRVIAIAQDCLPKPWPDLTIILDVDLKTAARRLSQNLDRMEQKGDGYHQRVRAGFLSLAEQRKKLVVIDASASIEEVHQRVTDTITKTFS
jgi:dTMP kinase